MDLLVKAMEMINTRRIDSVAKRYAKKKANKDILKLVSDYRGATFGSVMETHAKLKFSILKTRTFGDTDHDHTIKHNNKIIKVEQKASTLDKYDNLRWQHIEQKHNWDILLLTGIHYKEIKHHLLSKDKFNLLINKNKITNQGGKNGTQGYWCKYSNIKDSLVTVTSNKEIHDFIDKISKKEEENDNDGADK